MYREHHEEFGLAHEKRPQFSELVKPEIFPEEKEAYLLDLLYRKVINSQQYDLLLKTQVYKRMSQKEWAEMRGVTYSTVRSWHHRAEKAIRRYEEKRKRKIDDL